MIDAMLQSGVCLMKKGDAPGASRAFKKVIASAPDSTQAMTAARYLQSLGQ